jgi:hypothetical protein
MANSITEITRRALSDLLTIGGNIWQGRLSEVDFLRRLYDLTQMPSFDRRYQNAAGDIQTHGSNGFQDWESDWIFSDSRFNLLYAPDEELTRFLCETIHPIVRPDVEMAKNLATSINQILKADGWELYESKKISGHPLFSARKIGKTIEIIEEPSGWEKVDRQIEQMKSHLMSASKEEDFQTVGLIAREALISLAQAVYDPAIHGSCDGVTPSETDAKRMLESYLETKLSGQSNEESRSYAKTAVKLANALQHHRIADYKMAALCAEATKSCVNIVTILSDR